MDMKDIFENGCFSPGWIEKDEPQVNYVPVEGQMRQVLPRKDLSVLLAELEDIKNNIEEVKAKQWYLARLVQYHNEGFART